MRTFLKYHGHTENGHGKSGGSPAVLKDASCPVALGKVWLRAKPTV